jgi:integrase
MKRNQGDFGTVTVENGGTKFYFRCRSFVNIATGQLYVNKKGEQERGQQKVLLATRDTSLYKNLRSSALHVKAGEIRRSIIAWEEAALNGQVVAGDGTVPAPPVEPIAPNGDITIAEFFEKVFIPAKRSLCDSGKLAAVTFETYQNYWDLFLKMHLNHQQTFRNYSAWKGQSWLENLKKEDGTLYGENTVRKIRSVASAIFTDAIERGFLDSNVPPKHNPWKDIRVAKLPSTPTEQGVAYTEAEVETIIRNLDLELGATNKPLVEARDTNIRNAQIALALGFWAGLRPSEITALRWENVDVTVGTITVCASVVNGIHAKRTKTGENRVVTYLEPLIPILQAWHKRQGSPKSGLVIHRDGEHVSLRHLSDNIIKPSCEKHGLGERWEGFYGCRRGCGTLLVQVGATVEQGAKFLGNTTAVFEANYWVDKGEASAQGAEVYRRHKLAQAQREQVAPGLTEQKRLHGELAALGLGDGGAE